MPEIVLVTGGTGYVARRCILALLAAGYEVRTTIRDLKSGESLRQSLAQAGADSTRLTFYAADLLSDAGWQAAMAGVQFVLHVASPLNTGEAGGTRESYVDPARDGTRRVLRAAIRAGVRRVVMTSAAAAARPPLASGRISDETVWADDYDPQFDFYRQSKILAERAAWDVMEREGGGTELVTILPGAVFGPIMPGEKLGSVRIIANLLEGKPRAMPKLGFWVVDVRDLADIHLRAMTEPSAAGQRYIAAGEFLWMEEIAEMLRGLGHAAAKVSRRRLPTFIARLLPAFIPEFRSLAPLLGHRFPLTADKARRELGFAPRPARETILETGRSIVALQPASMPSATQR